MKTNIIITLWMTLFCNAFAGTDPNILNIQFHGSLDQFIVIEERSPRERIYRSVEPNLAADFSFYVDKERSYILNSMSGLHYLSYHWPFFMKAGTAMFNFNIVSRYWKPYIDPNKPTVDAVMVDPVWVTKSGTKYHTETCRYATTASKISLAEAVKRGLTPCSICKPYVVEPNVIPDPNSLSGYLMCYSDEGNKIYHDPNCPYAKPRRTEPIPAKDISEYKPCPVCIPAEPTLEEMLKDVTDPVLEAAIRKMMEKQ